MMYAAELDFPAPPTPADLLAGVRAQVNKITNRAALLDSYRRESLGRLATSLDRTDYETVAMDLAYGLRWLELNEEEVPGRPALELLDGMADE
ncbi:MAG TPA: hypothetical protein VF375_07635 [Candidatus Limnocylindrales bacterium]